VCEEGYLKVKQIGGGSVCANMGAFVWTWN